MARKSLVVAMVLMGVMAVLGKSSKLIMSWKDPDYSPQQKLHRILALGLSDKTGVRADFEDALAAQIASLGYEAVPGNTILLRPPGAKLDLTTLREQIRANQIEAVVVSRLIKVEDTTTYVPGSAYVVPSPYYRTFYGYYGTLYPVVYSSGYLQQERKVRIETNLYLTSTGEGRLVWTGITDTLNPSDAHKAIKGLVKLVGSQMKKENVL